MEIYGLDSEGYPKINTNIFGIREQIFEPKDQNYRPNYTRKPGTFS